MFETASRLKLRFDYKGQCSVEDLWDIPLTKLDLMYQRLAAEKRAAANAESLLAPKTVETTDLDLKLAVLRRIVEVRLAEQAAKDNARERAERKRELYALIADKQKEELRGKSLEDLQALVNSL